MRQIVSKSVQTEKRQILPGLKISAVRGLVKKPSVKRRPGQIRPLRSRLGRIPEGRTAHRRMFSRREPTRGCCKSPLRPHEVRDPSSEDRKSEIRMMAIDPFLGFRPSAFFRPSTFGLRILVSSFLFQQPLARMAGPGSGRRGIRPGRTVWKGRLCGVPEESSVACRRSRRL